MREGGLSLPLARSMWEGKLSAVARKTSTFKKITIPVLKKKLSYFLLLYSRLFYKYLLKKLRGRG